MKVKLLIAASALVFLGSIALIVIHPVPGFEWAGYSCSCLSGLMLVNIVVIFNDADILPCAITILIIAMCIACRFIPATAHLWAMPIVLGVITLLTAVCYTEIKKKA